jgi:hypothetical protein
VSLGEGVEKTRRIVRLRPRVSERSVDNFERHARRK